MSVPRLAPSLPFYIVISSIVNEKLLISAALNYNATYQLLDAAIETPDLQMITWKSAHVMVISIYIFKINSVTAVLSVRLE